MSLKVESLEKNMVKLTITVDADNFEKAIEKAYLKNKNKIAIQGFRKGKAPRNIIEKIYGTGVFYEDAANELIPDAYEEAAKESGLEIVSRPEIDVDQIESGKDFIFTAVVAVKPDVTLGEYKGIEVKKEEIIVTDEEVEEHINKEREQNSRMVSIDNRPIENGDIAVIDYEGFIDGIAFEGGKDENHSLTIGSNSFIDNFEEQLIGKSVGEDVEVNVNFPEEYHSKELAGKPAVFKVKINEITVKELPELDDDFAQDVSEFDTLDEYKEDVKTIIYAEKEKQNKTEVENIVVDKIIENATMEIPEAMIDTRANQMANDFAQRMQYQGLSMEQYLQYTGMDGKSFIDSMKPQAEKSIKTRLVLEKIVEEEKIEVSEDEFNKEIEEMAAMYQVEADKVRETIADVEGEQIKLDIAVQKAVDLLISEVKYI